IIDQISTEEFKPEKFEDDVRKRMQEQIQRKVEGQEIQLEPEKPQTQIIDLMEALKASLASKGLGASPAADAADARKHAKRAAGTELASATPETFHVTASANGSTATAEVRINGAPQVGIAVDPLAAALAPGAKLQLSATISGPADRSVVWQVQEGDSGGRIDGSGLYTAPEAPGTYHVVAASHAVPGASVTATVSVALHPTITVSIDPPAAALRPGSRLHFAAAVSGTSNTGVQWFVAEGAAGGTIDAGGTYTAPGVEGLFHL